MKNAISVGLSIGMVASLAGFQAYAGNDAGHGGDAYVCFDIPVVQAIQGDRMSAAGRRNIRSAVTAEYHRVINSRRSSSFIDSLKGKPYEEVISSLLKRFESLPRFYRRLSALSVAYERFSDGFASSSGLYDLKDEGFRFPPTEDCSNVQAVVRTLDQFSFDPDIAVRFDGLQEALMQFHELVWALANTEFNQNTSANSSLLISAILKDDLTDDQLQMKLEAYGFGKYWSLRQAREREPSVVAYMDRVLEIVGNWKNTLNSHLRENGRLDLSEQEAEDLFRTHVTTKREEAYSLLPEYYGDVANSLPKDKAEPFMAFVSQWHSCSQSMAPLKIMSRGEVYMAYPPFFDRHCDLKTIRAKYPARILEEDDVANLKNSY